MLNLLELYLRMSLIPEVRFKLLVATLLSLAQVVSAVVLPVRIEAEQGTLFGSAQIEKDSSASGGAMVVGLGAIGAGLTFANLPATEKLAIHYATKSYGTFSLYLNDVFVRKINLHSSGALRDFYLDAVVEVTIPSGATLKLQHDAGDADWNVDFILVGDGDLGLEPDIWNLPPLPIAAGPFKPDWKQISRTYQVPDWFRDAKFGVWSHWDPQSVPELGDWYACNIYLGYGGMWQQHMRNYGHVSEIGYKDICRRWTCAKWNPDELAELFKQMGARYLLAMGNHHDNFDCWNSRYQPWNAVNVGPKKDIVGIWGITAQEHGLRFGIGFHASPARTWGQFMPVRYGSDKAGPKAGVPYDGLMTITDGAGKWWQGLDPVDLYGPPHNYDDPSLTSPFANQFMWRVDDAIEKYHPDLIYFDEHAGNSQVDLKVHMGLDFLSPQIAANYYNKSLRWSPGKLEVVLNLKGVGGVWNSFQHDPELVPLVDRSLVKDTEAHIEPAIMDYPFQTDTSIQDWHYRTGGKYSTSAEVIEKLLDNVCRNGNMILNVTQRGAGNLDDEAIRLCKRIGAWLKVNGEAIYASRPFEVYGEKNIRYTRGNGYIYAAVLQWPTNNTLVLSALKKRGATIGNVTDVTLLGNSGPLSFEQNNDSLTISAPTAPPPSEAYVLKIAYDKSWVNDDDPGVHYQGWEHRANLGDGSYNNDLHFTSEAGDVCDLTFNGTGIDCIGSKSPDMGSLEVFVDGVRQATADLQESGARKVQQVIFTKSGLTRGNHAIKLVSADASRVEIDGFRTY